ncbi:hypothetical protein J6590_001215 [Homalodisca vitripennis]|nr:hypothetical protein J6590_001215 [Homalodisca vitripennis]
MKICVLGLISGINLQIELESWQASRLSHDITMTRVCPRPCHFSRVDVLTALLARLVTRLLVQIIAKLAR